MTGVLGGRVDGVELDWGWDASENECKTSNIFYLVKVTDKLILLSCVTGSLI